MSADRTQAPNRGGSAADGITVIKLGGDVVASAMVAAVAQDVAALSKAGARMVIVHGGGPQASALQVQLGQTPQKIGGRRVTDTATLDVLKMVIAGKLNIDLCSALLREGATPMGLHGASAHLIEATRRPPRVVEGGPSTPVDLGLVGDIVSINEALIMSFLEAGQIPVVACLGANRQGEVFNINADVVARQLAIDLQAHALVLVSHDVSGVLVDVADPSSKIATIDDAQADQLIDDKVVTDGMVPKVVESLAAIKRGVHRVHIVGRLRQGDLIAELEIPGSIGTVLMPPRGDRAAIRLRAESP